MNPGQRELGHRWIWIGNGLSVGAVVVWRPAKEVVKAYSTSPRILHEEEGSEPLRKGKMRRRWRGELEEEYLDPWTLEVGRWGSDGGSRWCGLIVGDASRRPITRVRSVCPPAPTSWPLNPSLPTQVDPHSKTRPETPIRPTPLEGLPQAYETVYFTYWTFQNQSNYPAEVVWGSGFATVTWFYNVLNFLFR